MRELFNKQVNAQKDKGFQDSRKLPQAHQKICNENESRIRKKRHVCKNVFDGRGEFIKALVERSCHGYQQDTMKVLFV